MKDKKTVTILNVKVDVAIKKHVLEVIRGFLYSVIQRQIVTINAEFIMDAQKNERFREILNTSALRLADGIGLLWAARYLSLPLKGKENHTRNTKSISGKFFNLVRALWQMVYSGASLVLWPPFCRSIIPERISGTDLVLDMCALAEREHKKIFLLGGTFGVADRTAKKLKNLFPRLQVVGAEEGLGKLSIINYQLSIDHNENNMLIERINSARPDILFVAFGHPKQEMWIARYLEQLPSVRIAMGVGGAFDFIAGKTKRAPVIFRNLGIEWLWRVVYQPWRYKRIITATFFFITYLVLYKLKFLDSRED